MDQKGDKWKYVTLANTNNYLACHMPHMFFGLHGWFFFVIDVGKKKTIGVIACYLLCKIPLL